MKTYEEMARDVLRRRDEQLQNTETLLEIPQNNTPPEIVRPGNYKKSRLFPKIAIPFAASLAVVAATLMVRYGNFRGIGKSTSDPSSSSPALIATAASGLFTSRPDNTSESVPPYVSSMPERDDGVLISSSGCVRILDSIPDHLRDCNIFYGGIFVDLSEKESLEEIYSNADFYYGMEFTCLGKRHENWQTVLSHSGIYYYINGSDRQNLYIEGVLNDFSYASLSPFDITGYTGPDIFSEINGKKAIVYNNYPDGNSFQAIIDFDKTLVRITSYDIPKDEFIKILEEYTMPNIGDWDFTYTKPEGSYVNGVFIQDRVPEYLVKLKHRFFDSRCITEPVIKVPFTKEELNSYYELDVDRLGRLNPDWGIYIPDELGIFVYNSDVVMDEFTTDGKTVGGREVISSLNEIVYRIKDVTSDRDYDLIVDFERIGVGEGVFSPFDAHYYTGLFSSDAFNIINGRYALVYRNTAQDLEAIIEWNNTLVRIIGSEMGEEEFLFYLEEFTGFYDVQVDIIPWEVYPQEQFASYIENYTPPKDGPRA